MQAHVRSDLQQEKAFEAARVKAAEVKARAASAGLEKAAAAQGLVRKETPGLVSRGQAMGDLGSSAALDEAAYALPDQTLSDPIRVPGGWAVIRVLEKKAFDPAAFEKEKVALIGSLRQQHRDELFRSFMQEARSASPCSGTSRPSSGRWRAKLGMRRLPGRTPGVRVG